MVARGSVPSVSSVTVGAPPPLSTTVPHATIMIMLSVRLSDACDLGLRDVKVTHPVTHHMRML